MPNSRRIIVCDTSDGEAIAIGPIFTDDALAELIHAAAMNGLQHRDTAPLISRAEFRRHYPSHANTGSTPGDT